MSLNNQLKHIIAHGYEHAPALRDLMNQAGVTPADIQTVADLPKIPVTTKDKLAEMQQENPPFGGWLAVPLTSLHHIFVSPGPLFEPDGGTPSEQWGTEAFQAIGIGEGDVVFNTFAYHMVPAGFAIEGALRAVGATIVPSGPGNTENQLQLMLKLGATGYIGTPSFLKIMFQKADEIGIPRQDIPLKKALFSGEPYPPSMRKFFEQEYGMTTSQAYATAELGILAYDYPGETALKLAQNMIVEIADPETGQPVPSGELGHVVVTTFNETYPLVRLGIGDLSAFVGEPDTDGFYTHIKGWSGRVGDAVKVRGMFLHPLQLKIALAKFDVLGNVQAIITRPDARDCVTLQIELNDDTIDQETLKDEVKDSTQQACRLRINEVEFIAPNSIDASARTVVDQRKWE